MAWWSWKTVQMIDICGQSKTLLAWRDELSLYEEITRLMKSKSRFWIMVIFKVFLFRQLNRAWVLGKAKTGSEEFELILCWNSGCGQNGHRCAGHQPPSSLQPPQSPTRNDTQLWKKDEELATGNSLQETRVKQAMDQPDSVDGLCNCIHVKTKATESSLRFGLFVSWTAQIKAMVLRYKLLSVGAA